MNKGDTAIRSARVATVLIRLMDRAAAYTGAVLCIASALDAKLHEVSSSVITGLFVAHML